MWFDYSRVSYQLLKTKYFLQDFPGCQRMCRVSAIPREVGKEWVQKRNGRLFGHPPLPTTTFVFGSRTGTVGPPDLHQQQEQPPDSDPLIPLSSSPPTWFSTRLVVWLGQSLACDLSVDPIFCENYRYLEEAIFSIHHCAGRSRCRLRMAAAPCPRWAMEPRSVVTVPYCGSTG